MKKTAPIKSVFGSVLAMMHMLLCFSCEAEKEFRVDVVTDDIGTQNVTVMYLTDAGVHVEEISAIDGRFSLTGSLRKPALIEVFSAPGVLLGQLIAEGGDHVEARLSAKNPASVKIEGNKDSRLLNEFLTANREAIDKGNAAALNSAVDAFVRGNKGRFVAAVVLSRYFLTPGNESQASELASLLDEKWQHSPQMLGFEQMLTRTIDAGAIPLGPIRTFAMTDTAEVFSPAEGRLNLVVITDNDCRNTDSLRIMLTAARAAIPSASALTITDMGCDRDTMMWKLSVRNAPEEFSEGVRRLWLPAGVATEGLDSLAPTDIPYFILADSTGKVLFRGNATAPLISHLSLHARKSLRGGPAGH